MLITPHKPLVSVYMPTHNRVDLMTRAIHSVLNQTYQNIEILVVNDGSTDETQAVLEQLQLERESIKAIHIPQAQGACAARNTAIENASGFFITGLDDDDEFSPTRIEEFVTAYEARYSFLCSSKVVVTEFGDMDEVYDLDTISFEDMKGRNCVGNQIFIERSRLTEDFRFSRGMPAWQDYDLWFRLVMHYGEARKIHNHSYRMDLDSADDRISKSSNAEKGFRMFIDKYKAYLSDEQIERLRINDLYNRRVNLTLFESLRLLKSSYAGRKIFSLYLLNNYPVLYSRIVRLVS